MKHVANLLGFAQRAGKLASGETAVTVALRRRHGYLVILAEDAAHHTQHKVKRLANQYDVPVEHIGSKSWLGQVIGTSKRSSIVVTDAQFAKSIRHALREQYLR